MPNVVMSSKEVASLAKMPSRDELLATLMGTMQAPVAKFVRTLNEVPGKFVRALAAVRDQKAATGCVTTTITVLLYSTWKFRRTTWH